MSSPHQSVPPAKSSHTADETTATGRPARPGGLRAAGPGRLAAIAAVVLAYLIFVVVGTAQDWSLGLRIGLIVPTAVVVWLLIPRRESGPTPGVHVIGVPRLAYIGVLVLAFCVFFAFVGWPIALWWLLLAPVIAVWWVTRTHTTVSDAGLDLSTMVSSKHLDWAQVKGISIPKRGYIRARLADDSEVKLPAVGYDRLRELIEASEGRLPDVFAAAEAAEAERLAAERAQADASTDADADAPEAPTGETDTHSGENGEPGTTR
ncbi:PH domain-containing protein [Nocardia ignorata]|uniref:PH (Pleckstrin Homology) domain-containing protein n=1 Tax=Nocardia ignorata TaxID=145285 RepID=A0A4R6PUA8_NOCIG|nr:PH domain-containing protein [Nocardia ignorata]TDP41847.1 PH (Pleckstrin Homology) domain-containing protein [Nocardia ignorata]